MNLDHQAALSGLEDAYELICEFQQTIQNSLDNDHPYMELVDQWLRWYEGELVGGSDIEIEGAPI